MSDIAGNITQINNLIHSYAEKYARECDAVQLIAVSKTRPAEDLRAAAVTGQHHFGENYVQEALVKQASLAEMALIWHFIGPIQSNKTHDIATHFDWVHSVDRLKIARRLSEQRPAELSPLKILLQVNISGEASKSGVSLDALPALAAEIDTLPNLALCGLMAIPAVEADIEKQRAAFRQLREARDALVASGLSRCRELSMGMSGDLEAAMAEGATMVRVGTAIFGSRG